MNVMRKKPSNPLGYTLRRDIADPLIEGRFIPDFLEIAPENWMKIGGIWKRMPLRVKPGEIVNFLTL